MTQAVHDAKINLNQASREELVNIHGIGEGLADRIVEYREQHGEIASISELGQIRGFDDVVLSRLLDTATV